MREVSRSDDFDVRVRERLLIMSKAWDRCPGANLPTVFPERNARDAAYRLLASPRVTMDDILQPHREAVAERCALEATVLLVQDTTTLNYKGLRQCTQGLGSVGGKAGPADGFFVHAGLVLAEGGRALGVYWLRPWARLEALKAVPKRIRGKESKRWMEGLEQAVELGRACSRTRVIAVCDREGDIFPLLRRQAAQPQAAGLLVRASGGRQRDVLLRGRGRQPLRQYMAGLEPLVSDRPVRIVARGAKHPRQKRTALTEVRAARVQLRAPRGRGVAVQVLAVLVSEPSPSSDFQALHWLLLSSDGEATAEDALRTVARYERRWWIEEFFKVLKRSTKLLDRRLRDAASLESCLVFEAVQAWKVFDLTRLARERPEAPAADSFTEVEREVLNAVLNVERILPAALRDRPPPPAIGETVVNLARLAGFVPSKRQPLPGDAILWNAWKVLKPMVRWEEARLRMTKSAPCAELTARQ